MINLPVFNPPPSIKISIDVAPASTEFSINSFKALKAITSPAAILLTTLASKGRIRLAAFQASENARNIRRIKDAEKLSKRRKLVLPDPQINDNEIEEVVKLNKAGEYARSLVSMTENEATKGFIGQYSHINTTIPIRTPRIPAQEDNLIIEARNLKALTQQQSSLFKDENTPFHQTINTTFNKELLKNTPIVTPNPLFST
ncbi:hypothetical protein PCK1_000986 [Pneumocystis canis]|nr:hypothetical protein PCK1_000986 [Pneumocystis canis]